LESLTAAAADKSASSKHSKESPPKEKEAPKAEEKEKQPKSMDQAKVVVKQSGEKLDKKNSKFNYESVIEITLPSAPQQALPQQLQQVPIAFADTSRDLSEDKIEEPIKPIICTPLKPPKIPSQSNINMSPTSVHEASVVSNNKQNPMEWDSFIPVSLLSVAINSCCCLPSNFILLCFFFLHFIGIRRVINSTSKLPVVQSDGARR
jgi:hypothetical protein